MIMMRIILTAIILGLSFISAPMTLAADNHHSAEHQTSHEIRNHPHNSAHQDDKHHKETQGLPQLNPKWYVSQIFWLAVTFAFMYIPFKFKILPDLSHVIERRREQIQGDLIAAKELRIEAENVHETYNIILKDARDQASALFIRAEDKIKELEQQTFNDFYKRAAKKIEEAEKEVDDAKNNAMVTVNDIAAEIASVAAQKLVGVKTNKENAITVIETLNKKKAA